MCGMGVQLLGSGAGRGGSEEKSLGDNAMAFREGVAVCRSRVASLADL
jgi:hypothetical protein